MILLHNTKIMYKLSRAFTKKHRTGYTVYLSFLLFAYFAVIYLFVNPFLQKQMMLPKIIWVLLFAILSSFLVVKKVYREVFFKADKKLFNTRNPIGPTWVGTAEQLLYILAINSNNTFLLSIIPVWLGFKTAGIWPIWQQEKDRTSYNMYIFGNALSLLNAFLWAVISNPEILSGLTIGIR